MNRPRILFVENGRGLGGATRCLLDLVRHAPSRDYEPVVAIAYDDPTLPGLLDPADIIDISPFRRRAMSSQAVPRATGFRHLIRRLRGSALHAANALSRDWPLTRLLAREIRDRRIDIVHTNNGLLANRAEIGAARRARRPIVAHQRCLEWPCAPVRRLSLAVDRVIAISDCVRANLTAIASPEADIRRVYDGVDAGHWAVATSRRRVVRQRFGLATDDLVIAFPAAQLPWKGHAVLFSALASLLSRYPTLHVVAAGATPSGASQMRPTVEDLAGELGVASRVRVLGFQPDPLELYAAADFLVHASTQPEPLGLVILEAMAAGLPVVAPEVGGPTETVLHGQSGLLFHPGNPQALAAAIAQLLDNPALRDAMGACGAARAASTFNLQRSLNATFDHFDCVLAARSMATSRGHARVWRFAPSSF